MLEQRIAFILYNLMNSYNCHMSVTCAACSERIIPKPALSSYNACPFKCILRDAWRVLCRQQLMVTLCWKDLNSNAS